MPRRPSAEHLVESHQQHHASANSSPTQWPSRPSRFHYRLRSRSRRRRWRSAASASTRRWSAWQRSKPRRASAPPPPPPPSARPRSRYDAGLSEAAAAEREHQLEVLIVALKERTSEVERLGGEVKLLTQSTLPRRCPLRRPVLPPPKGPRGVYEPGGGGRALAAPDDESRGAQARSERQALKAEIERSNVRATSASSLADSLREELAALKAHARTVRRRSAQPPHPHRLLLLPSTSLLDSPLPSLLTPLPPIALLPFPTPAPLLIRDLSLVRPQQVDELTRELEGERREGSGVLEAQRT